MPLTTLPSAKEIRVASRLTPEQVAYSMSNTDDLEADISDRLTEQANYVETRLVEAAAPLYWPYSDAQLQQAYPNYNGEQITAWQSKQQSLAKLAVKYLTIADLYDSAGQLGDPYRREAADWRGRGENLLNQLVAQIGAVTVALGVGGGGEGGMVPDSSQGTLRPNWGGWCGRDEYGG